VGVTAVAEHGDIDQARRVLPDFGIDALEVDLLVEPAADSVIASIGYEMRKAADEFVVPAFSRLPQTTSIARPRYGRSGIEEKAAPDGRPLPAYARRGGLQIGNSTYQRHTSIG
jgi:hypothetical protein